MNGTGLPPRARRRQRRARAGLWVGGATALGLWVALLLTVGALLPQIGLVESRFLAVARRHQRVTAGNEVGPLIITPDLESLHLGEVVAGSRAMQPAALTVTNGGSWPVELRVRLEGLADSTVGVSTPRLAPGEAAVIDLGAGGPGPGEHRGQLLISIAGGGLLRRIPVSLSVTEP